MKGKRLLYNTILLTAVSLMLRLLALLFQVFLSRKMGAAGIGLFQLVMSVNSFAATVAISGVRFTATRIVSEELGKGNVSGARAAVKKCFRYSLVTGMIAGAGLFILAGTVGEVILGDVRTVLSLRILGISMPFLSAGAVLGGYFTGSCKIGKAAAAAISEQVFRVAVSVPLILLTVGDTELMCAAASCGCAAGEILSFVVIYFVYRADIRSTAAGKGETKGIGGRIVGMAVPLALAAYARTALQTVQNVLVPKGIKRSGASYETALAGYGTVQGMVFPVITFPMVLFSSISELIVPELTEEQVMGRTERISAAANVLLKLCLVFSVGIAGYFICFSMRLGDAVFKRDDIGGYIAALSVLMPVMYMDNVTDGMLRGLGQHLYSMKINIADSVSCTVMVWVLLPRYALIGYIVILYASEIFNFALSMGKLKRITRISSLALPLLRSLLGAVGAYAFAGYIMKVLSIPEDVGGLVFGSAAYMIVYGIVEVLLDPEILTEGRRKIANTNIM